MSGERIIYVPLFSSNDDIVWEMNGFSSSNVCDNKLDDPRVKASIHTKIEATVLSLKRW